MPPGYSISGIDWVASEVKKSGKPTVVSMSLGGGASDTIDSAVKAVSTEWVGQDDGAG